MPKRPVAQGRTVSAVRRGRVGEDLAPRRRLAGDDRQHRHAGAGVVVLDQERQGPEVGRGPDEDDREGPERLGERLPAAAAQPTSGGTAPAAPPMTMFCGVSGFSQSV